MLRGGPTKSEIIAIALEKLQIQRNETFADIGCGTGHVSIAAAKHTDKIIAVDKRRESIEVAQQNFEHAGVLNAIILAWGEAPDVLMPYENTIDKAFIGGTANFKEVIEFLIPCCRRLVLNAARLELAAEAIWYMKDLGIFDEALLINIAKGYELEGLTGFESHNPVFMVVGTC
ncbi:MAG: methyltransferase domain-containing protein [Euryarchaeota archaeon]|nr:methyltransferase domain-containing protein [Euryarchaeota archaeon]